MCFKGRGLMGGMGEGRRGKREGGRRRGRKEEAKVAEESGEGGR